MTRSTLQELVVVETAERVAGPYCGKLLADHGADVIKVEPPTGDASRAAGPFRGGSPDPETSAPFLHLNANKKSVVLDLTPPGGGETLRELVRHAGIVIDDGGLAGLGITYEALRAVNSRLVFVEITGFGPGGPYSGYRMNDHVAYASSAWMAAMGDPDKAPVYPGVDYPYYVAGLYGAFGSLAALRHAHATGIGQHVGVSVLDASISVDFYETTKYSFRGTLRRRDGHMITGVAASVQPCADGYIALTFSGETDWRSFTEVIGAPELAEGEFATAASRLERTEELSARLQTALGDKLVDDVVRESQSRRVAVTRVATTADVYASEQLRDRSWFRRLDHAAAGSLEYPGPPFRLTAPQWRLEKSAPRLGEHTDSVLRRFALGAAARAEAT